jgi:hypothetical protein
VRETNGDAVGVCGKKERVDVGCTARDAYHGPDHVRKHRSQAIGNDQVEGDVGAIPREEVNTDKRLRVERVGWQLAQALEAVLYDVAERENNRFRVLPNHDSST